MDKRINSLTDSVNVTIHASKLAKGSGSYAKVQRNTAYIGNIVERVSKNAVIPGGTETLLYVAGLLRGLGSPAAPEEIGVDKKLVKDTFLYCKEIRARYTILQMLWDLDVLDPISDAVIETL